MLTIVATSIFQGTLPKRGESPKDCQDACSVDLKNNRFAIADGVTQSFFPGEWARLLVNAFITDEERKINELFTSNEWQQWLSPIRRSWYEVVASIVPNLTGPKFVHIRNQFATKVSAASTFIGLRKRIGTNQWEAIIIGDSCIFHFAKDNTLNKSYCLTKSSDFNSHPGSFSSYPMLLKDKPIPEPFFINLDFKEGEIVIMATDAFSKWLLHLRENAPNKFKETIDYLTKSIISADQFKKFVDEARSDNDFQLESDDVGLIVLGFQEIQGEELYPEMTYALDEHKNLEGNQPFEKDKTLESSQISKENVHDKLPQKLTNQDNALHSNSISHDPRKKSANFLFILTAIFLVCIIGMFFLTKLGTRLSQIYFGTPTPTPTQTTIATPIIIETPTTEQTDIEIGHLMTSGDVIYTEPNATSSIIFTATKDHGVTVIKNIHLGDNNFWIEVEYSIWVVCGASTSTNSGGEPVSSLPAYENFSATTEVGYIPHTALGSAGRQVVIGEQFWCNIQTTGYILK